MRDLQEAIDLIEGGRAVEALPELSAWAQRMPTYAAVQAVLARAYEAAAQWDDARAAWERTHFLMPNSPAVQAGLARIRAAAGQAVPAAEDRLTMDLDLETELEATLEALFNPFTLPQQSETAFEEEPAPEQEDAAMTMVEAALTAAAVDDEAPAETVEDVEDEAADAFPADPGGDSTAVADVEETVAEVGLFEETETVDAEEAAVETAGPVEAAEEHPESLLEEPYQDLQDAPPARRAEEEQTPEQDLETLLEEEQKALEALEEMRHGAADEEDVDLADWDEFEQEPEAPPADHDDDDDLDRLINELESARIFPQPDFDEAMPLDLEDDIEDVVSETLARIYATQHQYGEAARVYEQLARQEPGQAERFNRLAAEMRALAGESEDQATPEEDL